MAATAYAALRSLLTTISMERTPSPMHPPFPFPSALIDSLLETVRSLVEFLEQDYCTGGKHLLYRITDLAYAAEDAIEFPILQLIRSRTAISLREELVPVPMGKDLEIIIQGLQDVLLLMKDKRIGLVQDVHPAGGFRSSGSSSSSSTAPTQMDKTQMVGFEEDRSAIIVELTRYDQQHRGLQIIPIVGMGGIGKTTLARNVYNDDHIMKHFDVRAWVTVSQQYNVDDILKGLLSSLPNPKKTHEISRELQLYQSLIGRRYLVVFDDMWSTDVWDEIRQNFPDNNNGDRIIVTTRLSNLVAAELSTGFSLEMKCLDVENSWNLFCEKVFPSKSCPLELQDVGRKIVRNCGGLPLAIAVIGGLLAKSNQTLKYWEHVAEDFHSCLYSSGDDDCSKILFLSYGHLPIHLKPCFLYLGVFPEDKKIRVSQLMSLWIAEGFLKPPVDKTLDANAIAEEYLKDLVERNLIMVSSYSKMGKMKYVIIHDLLRELCLREVQNDMFYCVVTDKSIEVPLSTAYQRRIVIGDKNLVNETLFSDGPSLGSIRHVRALLFTMVLYSSEFIEFPSNLSSLMPLRILFSPYEQVIEVTGNFTANFVNMRYFLNGSGDDVFKHIPYASIGLWRNFQMLDDLSCLEDWWVPNRIDIWDLVQLLRVSSPSITVPEHSYGVEDQCSCIVLENLQSLGTLEDFRLSEEAMRRIPNVKKLKVAYSEKEGLCTHYSAHNLERLAKLESFSCFFFFVSDQISKVFVQSVVFPPSLKKLTLVGCELKSEDMSTVFGSLPHLEVLKLSEIKFVGEVWNPVEGEFRCLKFLRMYWIKNLKKWNADGTHFPRLEILILGYCHQLEEIPLDFGEISTLRLIKLHICSLSAMKAAKKILEEQQSFGHDDFVVEVL